MTLTLHGREPKLSVIDQLQRLVIEVLWPHLHEPQREAVLAQFEWMRRQKPDLNVNCKLETIPELQLMRVTLELSFAPIKSMVMQ